MSNQTWNNDPKPEDGDGNNGGYTPPASDADQSSATSGYDAPSTASGTDAPGGYQPPSWDSGQTSGQQQGGYQPPSSPSGQQPSNWGSNQSSQPYGSGQSSTDYGQQQGGYGQQPYSVPSGPDQQQGGYGQQPYSAPSGPDQQSYPGAGGQPGYGGGQPGYDPNAGGGYGGQPGYDPNAGGSYGGQPGYDPNAGGSYGGQPGYDPNAGGSYGGQPSPYGAPGGYQPNPYSGGGPQLATWGRRAIGGLIDFVVPGVIVSIVLSAIFRNEGGTLQNILQLVLVVGYWCYNTGYRVATTGYSFGHKIAKVRVVMADTGQTPPQNTAILRAVSHLLDSWSCLIGWLFPLWDAKKQTFADKIAKTVVLDEQQGPGQQQQMR